MSSGQFTSFPIDLVFVIREERQRREITEADIQDKASSISKIGLINPITIERSGRLRAGETRWLACKSLGWTHIAAQFIDDLSEPELQLLELDENVRRKALSWQDECDAIAKYHALKSAIELDWSQTKTADSLGMSAMYVGERLAVKKELAKPESRVHAATKFSEARNIVARTASRAAASELATLENKPDDRTVPLLNVDFNLWQPTYDGPKFNFIHCDFPYGINADNQQQGANVATLGGYADGLDVYQELLATLARAMENVVAESAHLIFWYSMRHHNFTERTLNEMGWSVNPFPLIWHKSDNAGLLPDPQRGPRRVYESAFFASRGDRRIVSAISNAISSPATKLIHMSEKPLPVLRHFFRMVVDEYSNVLDPTCGSAGAIRAASQAGAASVLGLEKDEEFYSKAKERYHDDK